MLWLAGPLYYTKVAGFGEEQNGFLLTVQAIAQSSGLFFLLPLLSKCLGTKGIILLSVTGGVLMAFSAAMVAWPAVQHLEVAGHAGREWWPFAAQSLALLGPLWYPLMRATAATAFGPAKFAMALGAVATTQAVNGVVGPSVWPLIYGATAGTNPAVVFVSSEAFPICVCHYAVAVRHTNENVSPVSTPPQGSEPSGSWSRSRCQPSTIQRSRRRRQRSRLQVGRVRRGRAGAH